MCLLGTIAASNAEPSINPAFAALRRPQKGPGAPTLFEQEVLLNRAKSGERGVLSINQIKFLEASIKRDRETQRRENPSSSNALTHPPGQPSSQGGFSSRTTNVSHGSPQPSRPRPRRENDFTGLGPGRFQQGTFLSSSVPEIFAARKRAGLKVGQKTLLSGSLRQN